MGILDELATVPIEELAMGNWPIRPYRRPPPYGTTAALLGRELQREPDAAPSALETAALVFDTVGGAPVASTTLAGGAIALQGAAAGIRWMTEVEQDFSNEINRRLNAVFRPPAFTAMLPWTSVSFGVPHAHMHPPNLTPASAGVPTPFPSAGPVIPIPYLSTASTVFISGAPAVRCGDMGLAIWCGGYFPMFEVFCGSSSVWIEGMRAARAPTDVTSHCMFSSPAPTDPALGCMTGVVLTGAVRETIGGFPMPSLTSLAIAAGCQLAFSVAGRLYRRATAAAYVERLVARRTIRVSGSAEYAALVRRDLETIATTRSGRSQLDRIERSGHHVTIEDLPRVRELPDGCVRRFDHNAFARPDTVKGVRWDQPGHPSMFSETGAPGGGSSTTIGHSPDVWVNHNGGRSIEWWAPDGPNGADGHVMTHHRPPPPGTASDEILMHELTHSANFAEGRGRFHLNQGPGENGALGWNTRWKNGEEHATVWAENGYRRERRGPLARQRVRYGPLP